MWAVFLTQIFFNSRAADFKMAIDRSTVQLKHVCELQELCDYSPGFCKPDLKVSYIHSLFPCRAEPPKMLSKCSEDAHSAQHCGRDRGTGSSLLQCRKVFTFHSILFHHTILYHQVVIYKIIIISFALKE